MIVPFCGIAFRLGIADTKLVEPGSLFDIEDAEFPHHQKRIVDFLALLVRPLPLNRFPENHLRGLLPLPDASACKPNLIERPEPATLP